MKDGNEGKTTTNPLLDLMRKRDKVPACLVVLDSAVLDPGYSSRNRIVES